MSGAGGGVEWRGRVLKGWRQGTSVRPPGESLALFGLGVTEAQRRKYEHRSRRNGETKKRKSLPAPFFIPGSGEKGVVFGESRSARAGLS